MVGARRESALCWVLEYRVTPDTGEQNYTVAFTYARLAGGAAGWRVVRMEETLSDEDVAHSARPGCAAHATSSYTVYITCMFVFFGTCSPIRFDIWQLHPMWPVNDSLQPMLCKNVASPSPDKATEDGGQGIGGGAVGEVLQYDEHNPKMVLVKFSQKEGGERHVQESKLKKVSPQCSSTSAA